MEIRSRYSGRVRHSLKCPEGSSLTVRAPQSETDVNAIVERGRRTGYLVDPLKAATGRQPMFGDFSGVTSYEAACVAVANTKSAFLDLPARLRELCENDPSKFLDVIADPELSPEIAEFCVESGILPHVFDAGNVVTEPPAAPEGVPPVAPPAGDSAE